MQKILPGLLIVLMFAIPVSAGPLNDAAKKGDIKEIEKLIASGVDANEADTLASPLHWAAMNGHVDVVKLLIANGANLEAQSSMLGTPLHASARIGRAGTSGALLAAGADLNARDKNQFTPLMRAVIENRISVVDLLLSAGADFSAEVFARGGDPAQGPTIALHFAERLERNEVAGLLRAAGAGPYPPEVPTNLLASGNAERGRELANTRCQACHQVSTSDARPLNDGMPGPALIGIIGRPVAGLEYDYSKALVAMGGTWTRERFYQFAFRPMLTAPGTKMVWPPELTSEQVTDIAAYFASEAK